MMGKRQLVTVVIVALVVTSAIPALTGFYGVASDSTGIASANLGHDSCIDDAIIGGTSLVGAGVAIYDNYQDPCWQDDGKSLSESQITEMQDNGTYEAALEVIQTRDNEERLTDSILDEEQFSKNPVWHEAELQSASVYLEPNSTETQFVQTGQNVIEDTYQNRTSDFISRNYRDVGNAQMSYERLVEINESSLMHFYADGQEIDASGGVNFSLPEAMNDTSGHSTYTLPNGTTIGVASVEINGTTYTWEDDLSITMEDPAGKFEEVPFVGQDDYQTYDAPTATAESADLIVDSSNSSAYSTLEDAINDANDGATIYVASGEHPSESGVGTSKNLTIVGEDGAEIEAVDFVSGFGFKGEVHIVNVKFDGGSTGPTTTGADGELYLTDVSMVSEDVELQSGTSYYPGSTGFAYNVTISGQSNDAHSADAGVNHLDNGSTHTNADFYIGERFHSFTKRTIESQHADRDELLSEWGDTSEGYAHDVWNQLDAGALNITDIVTYEQMFGQSFDEDDTGSQAFFDAQYLQAGMSGHDLSATVTVDVQSGSSVLPDAMKSNEVVLSNENSYTGHLWTMAPPSSGQWQTDTTYDTADLGGPLYITYWKQTETIDGEGIKVETEPSTIAVQGEFRLGEIKDGNGTSVDAIDHGGSPRIDIYDPSTYDETVKRVNDRNTEITKTFITEGGSGSSGGQCMYEFPILGCMDSLFVSWGGFIVLVLGGYAVLSRVILK